MIKYITGRAGSGKSRYIFEDIKNKLRNGAKNIYVIVPDQYTYETEKQLIESLGGLMYVEVLSLNRFIHRILQAAGGSKEHYVSDQGRAMLILKAINEGNVELSVLKRASKSEAFYRNMSELIANFKRFCVKPEDLMTAIDTIDDKMVSEKLTDISKVYAALEDSIAPYKDSGDMLNIAASEADKAGFLRGAHIYIDGFETTANAMDVMVEALLPVCESINITFRMGEGNDSELFAVERFMLQGFRKIAESLGEIEEIIYLPINEKELPQKNNELSFIEKQYFAYPFETYTKEPQSVNVYIAENTIKEAELISRRILSLVRDKGYKYSDITVIVPDINEQGRIISRALREHGIAYYMDEKKSIYESPLPEFILRILSIAKKGFNSEDMLALLKTGLLCDKNTEYDMCHYIIEKGIDNYKFTYPFEIYRDTDLEPERERIVNILDEFIESCKKAQSYEHIARAIYKLISDMQVNNKIRLAIEQFTAMEENEIASVQTQCYNACMKALDNAVLYLRNTDVSLAEFIEILKAGFSMVEIGVIPGDGDAVLVGDLKRSMAGEIKALFIMGCQEGILPRIPDSGLLLNDDDVNILKEAGIVAGNDGHYLEAQDNLSLYRALSKPSELLHISYSLKDASEKVLRPSSIISRLKELFPNLKEDSFSREEAIEHITAPLPTSIYTIKKLRQYMESGNMAPEIKEAYRQLSDTPLKALMDTGEKALYYDGLRKRQVNEKIETVSASKIEAYASCPFKYLTQYMLKPVIIEPYELTPISQGNFFHKCLESFTNEYLINKDINSYSQDQIEKYIGQIIDKTANEQIYLMLRENARNEYMLKHAGELAHSTALSIFNYFKESKFRPEDTELMFGRENNCFIDKETVLEGKIDRVDCFVKDNEFYYSIIDYKSSAKAIDFSEVYNGLSLQPLLYLNALLETKRKQGINAHAAGAFYLKVDDPIVSVNDDLSNLKKAQDERYSMSGVRLGEMEIADALDPKRIYIPGDRSMYALDENGLDNLVKYARNKAEDMLKDMKKGICDINPIIKKERQLACEFCNYREICGYDEALHQNRPISKAHKNILIDTLSKEAP